jgi:hypothetical protein
LQEKYKNCCGDSPIKEPKDTGAEKGRAGRAESYEIVCYKSVRSRPETLDAVARKEYNVQVYHKEKTRERV